jgi:hypothetical protein
MFSAGPRPGGLSGCENAACTVYTTYSPFFGASSPQPVTVVLRFIYNH